MNGRGACPDLDVKYVKPHSMGDYDIPHAVCLPIDTPRDKAIAELAKGNPYFQPK